MDDAEVKIELSSDQLVVDTCVADDYECMPTSTFIAAILTLLILMYVSWIGFLTIHRSKKRHWQKEINELSRRPANRETDTRDTAFTESTPHIPQPWIYEGNRWTRGPFEASAKAVEEASLDFMMLMMKKLDEIEENVNWRNIQAGGIENDGAPPIRRCRFILQKDGSIVGHVFPETDPPPLFSMHTLIRCTKLLVKQVAGQIAWLVVFGLAYKTWY